LCGHQYLSARRQKRWVVSAYKDYSQGKQVLTELSEQYDISTRTIQRHFDKLTLPPRKPLTLFEPISLLLDTTFFSRKDGVLVFRADRKDLYWQFVESETIKTIECGLEVLEQTGYKFKSITIDGRKGVIQCLKRRYPDLPIQLCQFHQAQIVRRYTTNTPKTECGQALKALMYLLTEVDHDIFESMLTSLREQYHDFLIERNEHGQFKHRRLRSAFRSLKSNLPYIFTYKKYPGLNIPNTTNSCDGSFAHWKQKVKIHRGLRKKRRNKMINFLLT
jgi:hypothetical protein